MSYNKFLKVARNFGLILTLVVLVCGAMAFIQVQPVSAAPAAVNGITPSGLVNTDEPTYTWTKDAAGSAVKYQVLLYKPDGTNWNAWYKISELTRTSTTYSVTPDMVLQPGKYSWKVRYYDGKSNSLWSPALAFEVSADAPVIEPTAIPTEIIEEPEEQSISAPGVVFYAGHENGDLSEWERAGDFVSLGNGSYQVTTDEARSGQYSTALTINTSNGSEQAAYLFFWKDLPGDAYYYSSWYYIPENVTPKEWWNIWQWMQTTDGDSNNTIPVYSLGVRDYDGASRLYLTWRPDTDGKKSYTQTTMDVPKGRWFHIEAYYKESMSSDGQVIVWQDGVKIYDVTGNPTILSTYKMYFAINNFTDDISPAPCTIYVDDVIISTERMGSGVEPQPTEEPTQQPTAVPTQSPTKVPTTVPTKVPTKVPTTVPTKVPTMVPTKVPTTAPTQKPPSDAGIVFYAGHESGDLSEWTAAGSFIAQGNGTYKVNTVQAHSGRYAAALTIDTSLYSSTGSHASYLFFWKDLPGNAYYYSAWYFIPENVAPKDWWNVWQWKHTTDGNSSTSVPVYSLGVRNVNGASRLYLTWRPDLASKKSYNQTTMEIPKGRWFHVEAYYKESMTSSGQVIVWQDGVKIFDVTGNPTALSTYKMYFSVNNYTDDISPSPCTIYVDDVIISTNRISTDPSPISPPQMPTIVPTKVPTTAPTKVPTIAPTKVPTTAPTKVPTTAPTKVPTTAPTKVPTTAPTQNPPSDPGIVFYAGHESGSLSEWTAAGSFLAQGNGTYQVNTTQAHNGKYAAALTIDTSLYSSTGSHASYLFFWKDLPGNAYYYSAWYYIPENVTPQEWWNIWQWKHTYDGNSNSSVPVYTLGVRNVSGVPRLYLTWRPDLSSKKSYNQTTMEIPKGRWFHIEAYYKESMSSSGQVIVWQDGVKIFDVTGNPTTLSTYKLYFSVNNYTDDISPSPCTIYVDDVIISTNQVGVNYKP